MYMTKITLPALLLSAVLAAPAQNLLQNGDFEDDVAHWRSSGDPASVKTEIHDGSKALVLSGRGVKLGAVSQQIKSFPAGTKLILSGRTGTQGIKENTYTGLGYSLIEVVEKDKAGKTLAHHELFHERGTNPMHDFKKEFTTHSDAASLELVLRIFDADGKAYFDNLSLTSADGIKNLLRDGSFEETHRSRASSPWASAGNPALFSLDTENPFSGAVSARIDGSTKDGEGNISCTLTNAEPGKVYSFELRMRTADLSRRTPDGRGMAFAAVWQLDAQGKLLTAIDAVAVTEPTGWKKYVKTFKTLPETRRLKIILGLFQANGSVWFDDLSLGIAPESANKIENGDFELSEGNALSPSWACTGNNRMFAVEPDTGRNGGGALRISGSTKDGEGNVQYVVSDFKPDTLYDFSVWASTEKLTKRTAHGKGAGIVAIWQLNGRGELISSVDAVTIQENTPFRKFGKTIRTLPDARKLVIIFGLFQANGTIRFDDASLVESARAALPQGSLIEKGTSLPAPYVRKNGNHYILGNNRFEAAVAADTGRLVSLVPKHVTPYVNLLNAPASLDLKCVENGRNADFPVAFHSIRQTEDGGAVALEVTRTLPDGGKCLEYFRVDNAHLRWDAELTAAPTTRDREIRVSYTMPIMKAFETVFNTSLAKSVPLESLSAGEIRYRYDGGMLMPLIILGNDRFDFGLSVISPFELKRPDLSFLLENGNMEMRYKHFRYGQGSKINTGVALIAHESDFRPGFAWMLERYPAYFTAAPQTREREGLLCLSGPDQHFKEVAAHWEKRGVAVNIYGGHFPFYGIYAPDNREEWSVFINGTMSQKGQWTLDGYEKEKSALKVMNWPHNWWSSYARNRETIDEFKKHGIASYIYWNPSEVWIPYAEKEFRSDIAKDADGRYTIAIPEHYVLNQNPNGAWGRHIYGELEKTLKRYPAVDGVFIDRVDYISWDFGHDDGVTMINGKRAFTMAFALDEMLQKAYRLIRSQGKGSYANGPVGIELYRNLDAVLIENPGVHPIPQCFQFFGLKRPIVFSHTTGNQRTIEDRFKHSLAWGVYPVIAWTSPVSKNDDPANVTESYLPLFEIMKGRDWVLNAHAIRLPSNTAGNIFRLKDGSYMATVISPVRSRLGTLDFDKNASITVNPEHQTVREVNAVSVDYPGVFRIPFTAEGKETAIKLPPFGTALALLLNGHGHYQAAAIGMPLLKRGKNRLEFVLYDGSKADSVVLELPSGKQIRGRATADKTVGFDVNVPSGRKNFEVSLIFKQGGKQPFRYFVED